MSQFIDECNEGSIGIETIFRSVLYTDGGDYYINFLDSGLSEDDVNPINDCTDHRSLEQLFRLSIVEDLFGNPAISTVPIEEGTRCIDTCDEQGLLTGSLLYQAFYQDANGNIHLGILQSVSYDAEVQTIIDNFTGTYTTAQLDALNTFIVGTKTLFGISLLNEKFDLFHILAAANTNDANLNLCDLANFTLTEVNAPTFTAFRGYQGNGVNSYLNTSYNPSTDATNVLVNDCSFMTYSRTDVDGVLCDIGASGLNRDLILRIRWGGFYRNRVHDNAYNPGFANADSLGLHTSSRIDANNRTYFKNNTNLGADVVAATAIPLRDMYYGANNNNGVADCFSTRQYPFKAACSSVSFAQHQSFYSLLQAYLTVLGAQV